jgi:hypothetical protein
LIRGRIADGAPRHSDLEMTFERRVASAIRPADFPACVIGASRSAAASRPAEGGTSLGGGPRPTLATPSLATPNLATPNLAAPSLLAAVGLALSILVAASALTISVATAASDLILR